MGCNGCLLYRHMWLHLYLNGLNRRFAAHWTYSHLLDRLGGVDDLWGGETLADWLHCVTCNLQCCPGSLRAACCPSPEKGLATGDSCVTYSLRSSVLCDPRGNFWGSCSGCGYLLGERGEIGHWLSRAFTWEL